MYAIDEDVSADMWLGLNVKWSARWWIPRLGWFWCIGEGSFVLTLFCPLEFTFAFCCWLRSLLLLELKLWDGIDEGDVNECRGGWWECGFGRWVGDMAPLPQGEFWIPFEEHDVLMLETLWLRCHNGLELGLSPSRFSRIDKGGGAKIKIWNFEYEK